jgi:MFS family permease
MNERAAFQGSRRWLLLGLLLLGYIFNFLDRQVVSILQIPLKADLHLSDTQLGLLGGTAFAILYSTLAIPLALLADRRGRSNVIAAGIFAWSLFTAACGLVRSFPALFAARVGVGIGEAAGVAPSYALLAEAFPVRSRAKALAVFSLGIPFGSGLGIFFGGWLAQAFDWRTAFIVVGLAGVPISVALALIGRGRARGQGDGRQPNIAATARTLARKPSFWLLSFGAASASISGYGFGQWIPRMLHDVYGAGLAELGTYFGSVIVVGGTAGILIGGVLADRLSAGRTSAYALVPAGAFLLTAPLFAFAFYRPALGDAWIWYALAYGLSITWLGPIVAAIQGLVEPASRATASAMFLLINNLIGLGAGPLIFGIVSDRLQPRYGAESLRLALTGGVVFYLLGALLCGIAAVRLTRDSNQQLSER